MLCTVSVISVPDRVLYLALYHQFCNGIQLNRVLPPGPRDYWNQLAAEHKQAPEHQKWMYEADPFTARKAVDERQEKAAKKREEPPSGSRATVAATSPEYAQAPEVKMASSIRETVEESIKKVRSHNPGCLEPLFLIQTRHLSFIQKLRMTYLRLSKNGRSRSCTRSLEHSALLLIRPAPQPKLCRNPRA